MDIIDALCIILSIRTIPDSESLNLPVLHCISSILKIKQRTAAPEATPIAQPLHEKQVDHLCLLCY
jgi:hypothetical protein